MYCLNCSIFPFLWHPPILPNLHNKVVYSFLLWAPSHIVPFFVHASLVTDYSLLWKQFPEILLPYIFHLNLTFSHISVPNLVLLDTVHSTNLFCTLSSLSQSFSCKSLLIFIENILTNTKPVLLINKCSLSQIPKYKMQPTYTTRATVFRPSFADANVF